MIQKQVFLIECERDTKITPDTLQKALRSIYPVVIPLGTLKVKELPMGPHTLNSMSHSQGG